MSRLALGERTLCSISRSASSRTLRHRGRCLEQVLYAVHVFDPLGRPNEVLDLILASDVTAQVDDGVVGVDAHLALGNASLAKGDALDFLGERARPCRRRPRPRPPDTSPGARAAAGRSADTIAHHVSAARPGLATE